MLKRTYDFPKLITNPNPNPNPKPIKALKYTHSGLRRTYLNYDIICENIFGNHRISSGVSVTSVYFLIYVNNVCIYLVLLVLILILLKGY